MRHVYLDWFRNIGMLAIVWGHFFPAFCTSFVYAFSVPAFFALSGALSSRQPDWKSFWAKTFKTLIIPYLIICFIKAAAHIIKHIGDGGWLDSVIGIVFGFHQFNDAPGAKLLWFVYTLIVVKVLYQAGIFNGKLWSKLVLITIAIVGAYFYSDTKLAQMGWAVGNALLAIPFFMLGVEMKPIIASQKMEADSAKARWLQASIGVGILIILWWLSLGREPFYMYHSELGDNMLLSLLFAVAGMGALLLISLALNKVKLYANELLGIGGMILLGFQFDFIHPLRKVVALVSDGNDAMHPIATFGASVVIMLAFIPLTYICARWLPFLLGSRKINKNDKQG